MKRYHAMYDERKRQGRANLPVPPRDMINLRPDNAQINGQMDKHSCKMTDKIQNKNVWISYIHGCDDKGEKWKLQTGT